jgi:NTE family protein
MKIGLALSGGGYRATAFHVGTLRALNKLNLLQRVDVISTISGGSITGAAFCLNKEDFAAFDKTMLDAVCTKSVIRYILTSLDTLKASIFILIFFVPAIWLLFTNSAWIAPILFISLFILVGAYQFYIFPVSKVVERAYEDFFFNYAKLGDLPLKPILAIGSTNIQTSRPFTFSGIKMGDSAYAYYSPPIKFKHKEFPVARAVMASTCVPYAFSPVTIDTSFYLNPSDSERISPTLIDGGIYDNQGIHKITQIGSSYECDFIITSDAGNKMPFRKKYNNLYLLLLRTIDVFMVRIKNFQMVQNLYSNAVNSNKEIAYLSLSWELESCIPGFIDNLAKGNIAASVIHNHRIPKEWVDNIESSRKNIQLLLEENVNYPSIYRNRLTPSQLELARKVKTNLKCLSPYEADFLATHAANITELQVQLYCPSICKTKE